MSHSGGYGSTMPASHKFFKARRYFVCDHWKKKQQLILVMYMEKPFWHAVKFLAKNSMINRDNNKNIILDLNLK